MFVVYDRTPPRAYLALVNPYHDNKPDRWVKDEKSVINEKLSIYYKDLTGLLQYTDNNNSNPSTGTYTGYDNLTRGYGSLGLKLSPGNCDGAVQLKDNTSDVN